MGLEDSVLLVCRQTRIQREHLKCRVTEFVQRIGCVANLTLAAEEDQDITRSVALEFFDGIAHRLDLIAIVVDLTIGGLPERAVSQLYRIRSPRD